MYCGVNLATTILDRPRCSFSSWLVMSYKVVSSIFVKLCFNVHQVTAESVTICRKVIHLPKPAGDLAVVNQGRDTEPFPGLLVWSMASRWGARYWAAMMVTATSIGSCLPPWICRQFVTIWEIHQDGLMGLETRPPLKEAGVARNSRGTIQNEGEAAGKLNSLARYTGVRESRC